MKRFFCVMMAMVLMLTGTAVLAQEQGGFGMRGGSVGPGGGRMRGHEQAAADVERLKNN